MENYVHIKLLVIFITRMVINIAFALTLLSSFPLVVSSIISDGQKVHAPSHKATHNFQLISLDQAIEIANYWAGVHCTAQFKNYNVYAHSKLLPSACCCL